MSHRHPATSRVARSTSVRTSAFALAALVGLCLSAAVSGAADRSDDFTASYEGDDVRLVLDEDPDSPGTYTGTLTVGGQDLPARGTVGRDGTFQGTFESDGKEFDFTLEEGRDGGFTLSSDGADYELTRRAAPVLRGVPDRGGKGDVGKLDPRRRGGVGGAGLELPEFIKPGLRVSYHTGRATVDGKTLVLDEKGDIEDEQGRRYSKKDLKGAGAVSYLQIDVVHARPDLVAADLRAFRLRDVDAGVAVFGSLGSGNSDPEGSTGCLTGSAEDLGDFWVHPARLAEVEEGRGPDRTVTRERYTLGDQEFDAITIFERGDASASSIRTYDTASGLLLFSGTTSRAPDVVYRDLNGNLVTHPGGGAYSHNTLVSVRQTEVPWAAADEPAPDWVREGARLDYQITVTNDHRTGLPPTTYTGLMWQEVERVDGGCALVKTTTHSETGFGLPATESSGKRWFGPALPHGMWVPPGALERMEAGQVIDEDPVTRYRTSFAGVQGDVGVIVEEGPLESIEYAYDLRSGVLSYLRVTRRDNDPALPGIYMTEIQLTGQE